MFSGQSPPCVSSGPHQGAKRTLFWVSVILREGDLSFLIRSRFCRSQVMN